MQQDQKSVLLISQRFKWGGSDIVLLNLANLFLELGNQLIVYLLNFNQIIIRTKYTLEGELLKAVKK